MPRISDNVNIGKSYFEQIDISIVKSMIRIVAGATLVLGLYSLCGILIILAEVLGIAEEL